MDSDAPDVLVPNDGKGNEGCTNGCQQNDRNDSPSLETVLRNVMEMDFLTDEVKYRFIASAVVHNKPSPKARLLKCFIDNINVVKPERQSSFLKAAVTAYLNDKKSEQTRRATVAKQKQCTRTVTMIGDTVASRVNNNNPTPATIYFSDTDGDDLHEYDVETGNGETCEKRGLPVTDARLYRRTTAFSPDERLETRHSNLADALDSLGPGIIAKCTKIAPPRSFIPTGWYVRHFQCFDKTCQTKILVWSPTKELGSKPAFSLVYDGLKHRAHNPIDWEAWYCYKTGKNPFGPEWDVTTYPRRPGLPHFVQLAVAELLRIDPNIETLDAAKAVRERFSNPPHPLLLKPGSFDKMMMKQTVEHIKREKRHLKNLKTSSTVREG
ncbi:hypothetical protein IV203_024286 [Nitzschia inconspicua]|uniref:Uncharacterized protein n=1 Tax=Nitzschia inconspicua TaxID=303405 RepID=A0A9K3KD40_9STRA|nr:hypothetical protein IV203_024286 [Nitzschia inconspicua]